jgi:uncharacterized protein YyaL (SSP411 family)
MRWHGTFESGLAASRSQDKPLFLYFGAAWDKAAEMLEHETFVDPEVGSLLARRFVAVHVDTTDDEDPQTRALVRRFAVTGDPTVLVLAPGGTELLRINEYVPPRRLAKILARLNRSGHLPSNPN